MNIVDLAEVLLLHAGTAWVLWVLVLLSIASVAIATERGIVLRRKHGDAKRLAERLEAALHGDATLEDARRSLDGDDSSGAIVLRAGLAFADGGVDAVTHAMNAATTSERSALEARVTFLGTLGNNAPFIGLFGTVIGVVSAFDELGRASTAAAASSVASAGVMSAIAEALVATAVGIGVALPAVAANNAIRRKISGILTDAEALGSVLLAHVARRATQGAR